VGVVVHSGTAQSGHYYSYILDQESRQWLVYNDSSVQPYDVSTLKQECFGGEQEFSRHMTSGSAYLLFYSRTSTSSSRATDEAMVDEAEAVQAQAVNRLIVSEIRKDNVKLLKQMT